MYVCLYVGTGIVTCRSSVVKGSGKYNVRYIYLHGRTLTVNTSITLTTEDLNTFGNFYM